MHVTLNFFVHIEVESDAILKLTLRTEINKAKKQHLIINIVYYYNAQYGDLDNYYKGSTYHYWYPKEYDDKLGRTCIKVRWMIGLITKSRLVTKKPEGRPRKRWIDRVGTKRLETSECEERRIMSKR